MIQVRDLKFSIGVFNIDITLDILENEYFVLLGMTGSGKTLFLENLCGLRECASGTVLINGRETSGAEPRERGIGYVPQDGALFEHLNVRRNISFSLDVKGVPREESEVEVVRLSELLKIPHLLDRKIRGLSGGEKQRVALARALISRPAALILDEPVSALDEYTRAAVCEELKKLQRALKLPVIHVCHSFEEAKLVADRVEIMHEGRIIQTGTPAGLLEEPATLTVARILRVENIFEGSANCPNDGEGTVEVNGLLLKCPAKKGACTFVIRASAIGFSRAKETWNSVQSPVVEVSRIGSFAHVKTGGVLPLSFHLSIRELDIKPIHVGETVTLNFPSSAIHFLK